MVSLSTSDTGSRLDEEENLSLLKGTEHHQIPNRQNFRSLHHFVASIVLGISLFCNFILLAEQFKPRNLDKICSTYTTQYSSPILKDVDITYKPVHFNGSFMKASIYRQPPGPLVDEAWLALGTRYASIIVPEDEAETYGIQKGQVKRMKEQGGGFYANVEVFHHLHCLNLLRQTSHFNFEYYSRKGEGPFKDPEERLQTHIGHCIDILRQQVMCTADVGIFGQWWVKHIGPFVDFNTVHKCRNFEEIRKWAEKHQSSRENDKPQKMPGDIVLPNIP
ncbi:conserved hypothetical protein [Histoplasma capsulatum var. duboisii H88]|uniref:Tat pathway signal sequence n=1 Tax=Ajellomyces capsulatus (strain H88) TaxID=544711 RepID=F0UFY5_AJEC8|nr:conserved hypothetical protein [Histoplasma capsulatum var. duboisii H88]QSS55803.1 hypothetical protein I7I53_03786 [Histoplasma capsulatum var. duboisii H88]